MQVKIPDEQSPLLKDTECQKPQPQGITKLLAGLVGVFLASADKYVLLTTQTKIALSLQSPSSASLLLVSYNLGYCVALPVYGFLSHLHGSRKFLLISYALFAIGCAISGSVDSLWPFVFGRFLSGIGGAGMTDLLFVLINEVYDISEIASVRSYIMAAEIFGQGCGGPIGGLITDTIGWRWALLGQAPIGFLCLILAYFQLPQESKKHDVKPGLDLWSFDYLGLGAFVISATSFVLGTTNGSPILDGNKPALFTISAIFLGILFCIEKVTPRPMIPSSIITAPGLRHIFLGQFTFFVFVSTVSGGSVPRSSGDLDGVPVNTAQFLTNLPPYLSQIDHLNSSEIALRIWPSCIGLVIGTMIAGKAMRTTIKYRQLSLIGIGIAVASLIVIIIRWNDGIQGVEVYYGLPMSVGCGIFLSAQFLALTVRSAEQFANATAIYCLVQQISQIVGTSGSTAALHQLFRLRLNANLDGTALSDKAKIIHEILQNYGAIARLPEIMQKVVQLSYIEAFRLVPALSTILTIITGVFALFT
ncbi:MFS general substrate transporter [Penicillium cosmopolitanum]|uniref:MFS general substrate transporter n=1 Tax=Penicillium cosmopolitanum TaxID=1131564 RepID=A0A9W9VPR6_9EURO|nr:MFS general substrate transporter [Penicillium cosmopolitanum]KAJ5387068.1 MFS general substrate transporter [Penicillium cosmopolitanum]